MEKNNIQSKGIRTLTQEELNHISGGFWGLALPIAAAIISSVIKTINHRKRPLDRDDY